MRYKGWLILTHAGWTDAVRDGLRIRGANNVAVKRTIDLQEIETLRADAWVVQYPAHAAEMAALTS